MRIGFDVAEEVQEYDQEELQARLVMGEGVEDDQQELVELLASHGEGEDHELPRNISQSRSRESGWGIRQSRWMWQAPVHQRGGGEKGP